MLIFWGVSFSWGSGVPGVPTSCPGETEGVGIPPQISRGFVSRRLRREWKEFHLPRDTYSPHQVQDMTSKKNDGPRAGNYLCFGSMGQGWVRGSEHRTT